MSNTAFNSRQQLYIKSLVYFTDACMQQGMHAAQGLRLAKRHFPNVYNNLKLYPTRVAAQTLAQSVKQIISRDIMLKIKSLPMVQPDHFALQTVIPTNLNSHTGYLLLTKDVHPDIQFIRTQRRYNKRRYARVRAVSRPSF